MTAGMLEQLLGHSPALEEIRRQVLALLAHGSPRLPSLLIEGETGTGKGLLARALHAASPRSKAPFIDINCAAIPESLLEAELFGYAAGAFSSARRAKPGLVTLAHGGTLFLDELAALPLALQAKLLTAVEEQRVRPLGSTRAQVVDVWVLSATSEGLTAAVHEGRFRRDLYHRLARLALRLPPLRERGADVILLARHFLARAAREHGVAVKTLAPDAGAALRAYGWPGNVRELSNLMERLTLLGDGPTITAAALELPAQSSVSPRPASVEDEAARKTVTPSQRPERPTATPRRRPRPASRVVAGGDATWRLRRITALGIEPTAQALDFRALAARGRAVIRDKIEAFGGTVDEGDDLRLLALFGLEPSEDAPIRAAHAAMAVVAALRRVPDLPSIVAAIDVLEARVGERGGRGVLHPDDAEAALHRLRPLLGQAQPADVVASAAALPHLERAFDDAPLPDAGGAARLVRAGGAFAGTSRRTTSVFVGRDRELAWLARQVERLEPGQGRAIGLIGEPGAGKSRLLHEMGAFVAPLGVPWLQGRCVDHGTATPFLPLVDLLRRSLGAEDPAETVAALGERLQQAGLEPEQDAPYLERLLGLPGADRLPQLNPEKIRTRTFEVLRRIIQPGGGPVVVAIEDLHWIDRTSETFLGALVDAMPAAPLLLIATYRAGYRPPWIARSTVTQLAVRPLDAAAGHAIVSDILRTRRADEAATERLVQQGEGNPFFLEELAWSVATTDGPGAGVPRTVHDALSARIDRLPAASQRLLETASVLGREAPAPLLEALLDDHDTLVRDLDPLIAREFIREHQDSHGPVYAFKHALTQEVAYGRLAPTERQRLHAAAGREIERIHAGALDAVLPKLARHAVGAERWVETVAYLRRAAAVALDSFAAEEAAACLDRAVEALTHLPTSSDRVTTEIDTRLELRNALFRLGRHATIAEHLARAQTLAEQIGDEGRLGWIHSHWAYHFSAQADDAQSEAAALKALAAATKTGDQQLELTATFHLAQLYARTGQYARAATLNARLVDATSTASRGRIQIGSAQLVVARLWLLWCLAELGSFDEGLRRAEALARTAVEPFDRLTVQLGLGLLYLRQGRLAEAIATLEGVLPLCRTGNLAVWLPAIASPLGYAYVLDGRLAEGLPLLQEAVDGTMQRGAVHPLRIAHLAEAHLLAGDAQKARDLANHALEAARTRGERAHEAYALRVLGRSMIETNSFETGHLRAAIELADELGMRPLAAQARLDLARAYDRQGMITARDAAAGEAAPLVESMAMRDWLGRQA